MCCVVLFSFGLCDVLCFDFAILGLCGLCLMCVCFVVIVVCIGVLCYGMCCCFVGVCICFV